MPQPRAGEAPAIELQRVTVWLSLLDTVAGLRSGSTCPEALPSTREGRGPDVTWEGAIGPLRPLRHRER